MSPDEIGASLGELSDNESEDGVLSDIQEISIGDNSLSDSDTIWRCDKYCIW